MPVRADIRRSARAGLIGGGVRAARAKRIPMPPIVIGGIEASLRRNA
jgi:hypothetical protein